MDIQIIGDNCQQYKKTNLLLDKSQGRQIDKTINLIGDLVEPTYELFFEDIKNKNPLTYQ